MAGNRKFGLSYIERGDIAALTKDAAEISGIPYLMDVDADEVETILNGQSQCEVKAKYSPDFAALLFFIEYKFIRK